MFVFFKVMVLLLVLSIQLKICFCHAPQNMDLRNSEMPVVQSRKNVLTGRWCSMARSCRHDRVPVCGLDGDLMGFKDLCDMYDYNCLRKKSYKEIGCPEDSSMLTVSRRPSSYYDE